MNYYVDQPANPEDCNYACLLEDCCRRIADADVRRDALDWATQYMAARGYHLSRKTIEAKYYAWRKGGREALIDKRKASCKQSRSNVRNPRFCSFWRALVTEYQRSSREAYKELRRRWFAGVLIPGYEHGYSRKTLPKGWSYANLAKLLPDESTLSIFRDGIRQAKPQLPQVYTTRAGSYPLEFVFFDDVWVDRLSYFGTEIDRCFQLGTLDFCTGKRLVYGTKFRHTREDGTHLYLTGDEMLLEICDLLFNVGYNAEKGTTFVVENGTASISAEIEKMLAILSDGKIRVDRSGKVGMKQALLGGYGGRAVGNPNHKAHLESWHNLFHNCVCYGNGTTGKDRRPPETLDGIIRAEKSLIKHALDLPIDRAVLLDHHLPSFLELTREIVGIVNNINRREDHALEGWEKCGFVVPEYTLDLESGAWGNINLIANEPGKLALVAQLPDNHRRLRRMSPAEAWDYSTAQPGNRPTRFSALQIAQLLTLGKRTRRKLVREGSRFVWRDKSRELAGQDLYFETRVATSTGEERELSSKASGLSGIVNPFDPFHLFVFDDRGRLLGTARQITAVVRSDMDGLRAAWGRAAERKADQLEMLRTDLAPVEAEVASRNEYNRRVIEGEPATPLELRNAEAEEVVEKNFRAIEARVKKETEGRRAARVDYGAPTFID